MYVASAVLYSVVYFVLCMCTLLLCTCKLLLCMCALLLCMCTLFLCTCKLLYCIFTLLFCMCTLCNCKLCSVVCCSVCRRYWCVCGHCCCVCVLLHCVCTLMSMTLLLSCSAESPQLCSGGVGGLPARPGGQTTTFSHLVVKHVVVKQWRSATQHTLHHIRVTARELTPQHRA